MNTVTRGAGDPASAKPGGAAVDRHVRRLHTGTLAASLLLYAGSPWLAMLRRLPREAGVADYAHLLLGGAALLLGVAFLALAVRTGRWRLYFPWASGRLAALGGDLAGLLRGRLPSSEGGGLNSALQGLALLALLATAATGAGWFVAQGTEAALAWRAVHATCAHALGVLVVVHAITALAHVIELARG